MPLTTIDKIKEFLVETTDRDDVRMTSCLTRASAIIEKYCRRTFLQTTYTGEMYDGTGTDSLLLRNFPIIGTPTVLEGGSALVVGTDPAASPTPEVLVYAQEGRLIRYFWKWLAYRNWYKVTYQAGYAAVPDEIVQVAIEMTIIMLKEKERAGIEQHAATGAFFTNYTRKLSVSSQWALDMHRDLVLGRAA